MAKSLITVADVVQAARAGNKEIPVCPGGCIITPGAADKAEELGVALPGVEDSGPVDQSAACAFEQPGAGSVVRQVCAMVEKRLPHDLEPAELEHLVRQVVESKMAPPEVPDDEDTATALTRVGEVCFVRGRRLMDQGAGPVPVAEKALVANAFKGAEGSRLAGGYMEWEKASFRRTVEHPEIGVVVSGELHLTVGGKTMTAAAGDMVYFPQGVKVIYSTPSRVKLACINCV